LETNLTRLGSIEHSKKAMMMRLHSMKDDLSETARLNVIGLLRSRLADCIELQMQTKQPRRNAKDPCRILLHKLFDEISEEVEQNLDNIAGRAAQLVGTAEGKTQPVGLESSLREYPLTLTSGHDQVTALADALSSFGKNVRQAIGQSFEYGDAVTANTFTRVSRSIEKWLWMVQAHLQEG
jgi:starvation-inducible DNA-binding protein